MPAAERITLPKAEEIPDLWNEEDPKVRIQAHRYERANLHTWSNQRIVDLARAMGCTIWLLCAQAGCYVQEYDGKRDLIRLVLDVKLIRKSWRNNLWPILLTLEFQRMEIALKVKTTNKPMLGTADINIIRNLRPS